MTEGLGNGGEGGWAMGNLASLSVSNSSYRSDDADVHDEELVTGSAPLGVGVALEDLIYKQAFQSGRKNNIASAFRATCYLMLAPIL